MVQEASASLGAKGRDVAYVDLAQEHLLHWMLTEGLFDQNHVVFKGGTALRKFVFGSKGRFSTDLDFWADDASYGDYVIGRLNEGFTHEGVAFSLDTPDWQEGEVHGTWHAECPELGRTAVDSGVEFSVGRHLFRDAATPSTRPVIHGVDRRLGFDPVLIPVYDLMENAAEKLSRTRRSPKARDLYDLVTIGMDHQSKLDQNIIRRLTAWKVFLDACEGLPTRKPFAGGGDYASIKPADVRGMDQMGLLGGRQYAATDLCSKLGMYFGAMGEPSGSIEERLSLCRPDDEHWGRGMFARWDEGL
jgi:hypothetical protein